MTQSEHDRPLYVGIDLGTSNSVAAIFDGDDVDIVRDAHGATLTPSIVRYDRRGRKTIGGKALRYLDSDPANTRSEFKRLMGTDTTIHFPAAEIRKKPQELAAEILASLRNDIREQCGSEPIRAVISVPALFELPQNSATSEAARLAGFEQVELLQEPIASALAAGWRADDVHGAWLVYDIGGGTFDVSLLETRDGLLRVIGHDGDNFLGGRDFDWAIVDWAIAQLQTDEDVELDRANPAHGNAIRALKRACEEAKISLSRNKKTSITTNEPIAIPMGSATDKIGLPEEFPEIPRLRAVSDEDLDIVEIDIDIALDRTTLERICQPVVERTIDVCRRLLRTHGIDPEELDRIVLVGGPTVMPFVREMVAAELETPVAEGFDPMTMVARGAALYAATANLNGRNVVEPPPPAKAQRVWLQYPPVSSDLFPHVVGRILASDDGAAQTDESRKPAHVVVVRDDNQWKSETIAIESEGTFVVGLSLRPHQTNRFRIELTNATGDAILSHPSSFTIVQGITINDPPLSRSIGVALADNSVKVYFERGAPLPAKRTFTHKTVETIVSRSAESFIRIPIIQGELQQASLCRMVGCLEIRGSDLKKSLPVGAEIHLTIEVDRGGRLSARALVPSISAVFEKIDNLSIPDATPKSLSESFDTLRGQVVELRTAAFRRGQTELLHRLDPVDQLLASAANDIEAARGGDEDAAQKARRSLIDVDAVLAEIDNERTWPEIEDNARETLVYASSWISELGTQTEQRLFDDACNALEIARSHRNLSEMQRQLRLIKRMHIAALNRHPDIWHWRFEDAASEVENATNIRAAQKWVDKGRAAAENDDQKALRRAVEELWKLLPADVQTRRLSHGSGVH